MKSRSHDDTMAELYRKDPEFERQVINDILEDENGDQGAQLDRTLSPEGNPALSRFSAILKVMGMRLSVQPLQQPEAHA